MECCKDCGRLIEFDEDIEKWFDVLGNSWLNMPKFHYHKPKGKTLTTQIVVTHTLVVTQKLDMSSYEGMTVEEAIEYERNLPTPEKLEQIDGAMAGYEGESFTLTTTVEAKETE